MVNKIKVEISVGELLDKVSILNLKKKFITDEQKLENIRHELRVLENESKVFTADPKVNKVYQSLLKTNEKLWKVEDDIRILEKKKQFGEEFITLARQVYIFNDERFNLKSEINHLTGSSIKEEKSYEDYS